MLYFSSGITSYYLVLKHDVHAFKASNCNLLKIVSVIYLLYCILMPFEFLLVWYAYWVPLWKISKRGGFQWSSHWWPRGTRETLHAMWSWQILWLVYSFYSVGSVHLSYILGFSYLPYVLIFRHSTRHQSKDLTVTLDSRRGPNGL